VVLVSRKHRLIAARRSVANTGSATLSAGIGSRRQNCLYQQKLNVDVQSERTLQVAAAEWIARLTAMWWTVVFIATAAVIYRLGHGLCTFTAVQCLGRQPSTLRVRCGEYELTGWVIITMAMVDVGGSSQFSAYWLSQPEVNWFGLRVGGYPALIVIINITLHTEALLLHNSYRIFTAQCLCTARCLYCGEVSLFISPSLEFCKKTIEIGQWIGPTHNWIAQQRLRSWSKWNVGQKGQK